ncbi:MAG TPA: TetR/AcrR family transcriptional regulator C-terminal domain-containing protein [Anaerolineales bacterium]|nr:TetR/AcrR family transcriptional regulator C-terminal domain-containing protein [Anaerolineales bacterium]
MNPSEDVLDLRVRRTYKFLWEALMSLLEERDLESITVAAICERAMVHRTTFYKHYEDKYGLLYHGIEDELNALFEAHDFAVGKPLEMDQEADMMARFVTVFEHVLKRERFYRLMFTGDSFSKFNTLLRKSLAERFERRLRLEEKSAATPVTLHAQLQAAAMVTMIAWWVENDCQYTPLEMTELLRSHLATRFHFGESKH